MIKKPSELLFEAAVRLQRRHDQGYFSTGCCSALTHTSRTTRAASASWEARDYLLLFSPKGRIDGYWFGYPYAKSNGQNTNTRVICLLLAAEVAKGEGR